MLIKNKKTFINEYKKILNDFGLDYDEQYILNRLKMNRLHSYGMPVYMGYIFYRANHSYGMRKIKKIILWH
jgi:hypothetical protein